MQGAELQLRQDVIIRGASRADGIDLFAAAVISCARALAQSTQTVDSSATVEGSGSAKLLFLELSSGSMQVGNPVYPLELAAFYLHGTRLFLSPKLFPHQLDIRSIGRSAARNTVLQAIASGERLSLRLLSHPSGVSARLEFESAIKVALTPTPWSAFLLFNIALPLSVHTCVLAPVGPYARPAHHPRSYRVRRSALRSDFFDHHAVFRSA